jgi:hypothetical protein
MPEIGVIAAILFFVGGFAHEAWGLWKYFQHRIEDAANTEHWVISKRDHEKLKLTVLFVALVCQGILFGHVCALSYPEGMYRATWLGIVNGCALVFLSLFLLYVVFRKGDLRADIPPLLPPRPHTD